MGNKTVIITGASSGIGAATALLLNQNNCNVVLAARRVDKLKELASQLDENHLIVETDVNSVDDVKNLVTKTVERFGEIDVLVNNAGLGVLAPFEEGKIEDWHKMFNVNVNGLLTCIHASLPHLLKTEGTIINLSSVAAHDVFPNAVVYCATKHAVNAIAVGIRKEFRNRVKVCNISPGTVETEFLDHSYDTEDILKAKESVKNNKMLQSEDIAESILEVLNKPKHVAINEVILRPNV